MTRDQIDVMWNQALRQSIEDGEQFTRYHFAALVATAEREACAQVAENLPPVGHLRQLERATLKDCAVAIRARGRA